MVSLLLDYKETTPSRACWSSSGGGLSLPSISSTQNRDVGRSILDPELTVSLPPTVTADCGYDALVHAIEPYVWEFQSDLVDALSVAATRTIFAWLPQAVADGNDLQAREKMHLASLQGYGGSPKAKRECGTFATPNGPVSLERCDAAVVQQP